MTTWVYKNIFLAGEMTTWSILHLTEKKIQLSKGQEEEAEGGRNQRET